MDFSQLWIDLFDFYSKNLRNNFFAGFLTIGTFLFAVKTFIVVKIKEDVFDTEFYRCRIEKHKRLNPKKAKGLYSPLRRLSKVLFYAALMSLLSATFQLTIGLYDSSWSALVCILSALLALVLLFLSMLLVKINLDIWIDELEKQNEK